MPDASFTITDENKREVLELATRRAMILDESETEPPEDYFEGMTLRNIWDEFRRIRVVRDVWADQGNQNKVVKTFIYDPILTETMRTTETRGFYLGHDQYRDYDEDEDEWYVEAEGPRIFFADGKVNGDREFWGVRNGQDFRDDEDVHPMETRVVVEGVQQRTNLYTGETELRIDSDQAKVQVRDHDADIPEPGLRDAIERSMYVAGDYSDRGIARGDTGDDPNVLAVLTIGEEDDVSFFEANEYNDEDTLRVVAEDKDGIQARFKLPIEQTNEDFGLDEQEAEREVYQQILSEQPVAVFGRFGLSYEIALTTNEDVDFPTPDGPGEVEAALNDVEEYDDAGWMTTYEDDGDKLKGIDLTDHNTEDEHGNEVANPVQIGPYEAYDVRQAVDDVTGETVWLVKVLSSDEDGTPWMDVREHPWTKVKLADSGNVVTVGAHVDEDEAQEILGERVESIENSGTANEGAFVCFLNQSGDAFLPESDPFKGKFDDLPGFDEVEDGAESESEDEGATQSAESPL